jgi:glucokinase
MATSLIGLVGDVGGTNARFALAHVSGGDIRLEAPTVLPAAEYAEGKDALKAFLDKLPRGKRPRFAVIAAAGPIEAGAVTFTNNTAWRFDEKELEASCGLTAVRLINDFTAQALAIDHLKPGDVRRIGPAGAPIARATAAIIGPGTGLGAAALVDDGLNKTVMTCEGGHVAFAPGDAVEIEILQRLTARFGRVSNERILSGPGLLSLYDVLCAIEGEAPVCQHPDEVTKRGLAGEPLTAKALSRFCAILGAVAGDFALSTGARRGIYIAGGIAPAILPLLESSGFRARFEAKGRMSDYMKAIPTFVVTAPYVAMIGAAGLLPSLERTA